MVGRILVIVRSFEHHLFRETGKNDSIIWNNVIGDALRIMFRPYIRTKGRQMLKDRGIEDRYEHSAFKLTLVVNCHPHTMVCDRVVD